MAERVLVPVSTFVDHGGDSIELFSDGGYVTVVADDPCVQLTAAQADDMATALHAHAARVRATGAQEVRRGR